MKYTTTSAIILRAIPFKDHQKIVTAFSKELGVISVIVKGLSSKKQFNRPFCEPFCEVELVISKKRGDLFLFHEGSIIDLHLPLRNDLANIKAASSMAMAILDSQLPEKPAPLLYSLFSLCLNHIPNFECQNTLLSCFYLKILKHEGIFSLTSEKAKHLLSDKERLNLIKISAIQKFSNLRKIKTDLEEVKKLESFFLLQVK